MRIGLNATCFNDRPSGANQRFRYIYGALIQRRPEFEFVIYEPCDHAIASWFAGAPNVIARKTPIPSVGRARRVIKGLAYWGRQLRADGLDLFETFNQPLLKAPDCPTVFTIHDLRRIQPGQPLPIRLAASLVLHDAFRRADRVIAVSDTAKREILDFHPAAEVTTVYNGVDPGSFAAPDPQEIAAVRERYALPERFVLAVGHLEERKNLGVLVEAIAGLRNAGTHVPLVIAGNDGGARAALLARIEEANLGGLVTIIGGADDLVIRALYAVCALVAFPSRYEGFGIPILEAMTAQKPLVLSDTAVFRELTENQGLYFPPDDAVAASAAIKKVWTDPAERARQIAHGGRRVRDFQFDTLADQVAAVYASLV